MAQTTTHLTADIIAKAKNSVDTYAAAINALNAQLESLISGLVSANSFAGDAASGYKFFYDNTAKPALTTNLITGGECLCESIKSMLDSIKTSLLDTVDPDMKEVNQNPGAGGEG